jgi:hypothetical protein
MVDDPMTMMEVDEIPKRQAGTSVSSTAIVKASNLAMKSGDSTMGYSHLRISNEDGDLCNDDDSYLDDYSHFKDDDSKTHSQSILIHQQAIEELCKMSQEVARGTLKQMQHQKICRPPYMKGKNEGNILLFLRITM